jgi:hypothetical protein
LASEHSPRTSISDDCASSIASTSLPVEMSRGDIGGAMDGVLPGFGVIVTSKVAI